MCPGLYCLCQETILKGHFIWLMFCGNCWLLLNRMNYTHECKQGCYIIDTMPFQWQAGRSTESSTKPLNPVTGAELNHCANGFHLSCCWNEKSWNKPKCHFMYNIKLVGFNFVPFCFSFVFERFLCTFFRTSHAQLHQTHFTQHISVSSNSCVPLQSFGVLIQVHPLVKHFHNNTCEFWKNKAPKSTNWTMFDD